jgi:DNA phosphorothioation system restriction enzyme
MNKENSVLQKRVIDNCEFSMVQAFEELLPLGNSLDMAVGFFFISGYELIQKFFNEIALRGYVRIIMGKKTNKYTANEIKEGIESQSNLAPYDAFINEIRSIEDESSKAYTLYYLRDLLALKKVAVKVYTGKADYFHAKTYLIGRQNEKYDGYAIIGSSNFSYGGLTGNTELNVLTMDSYGNLKNWFENIWESQDVKDFSMDLVQIIDRFVKKPRNYQRLRIKKKIEEEEIIYLPEGLTLREYQKTAIEEWFKNNGRGTLKMATGSGKTITALSIASKLIQKINLRAIIIICPYRHLVTQWSHECEKFGYKPILCFESRYRWVDELKGKLYNVHSSDETLCVITTNASFCKEAFQGCIQYLHPKTFLIADEVHNLGSSNLLPVLPKGIGLRLGLSATPERWFDDTGTQGLFDYFGSILKPEFTLKDAKKCGALVPYFYYPIFVELQDEEIDEYIDLSNQIKKLGFILTLKDIDNSSNNALSILLSKRARLIGTAKNKLTELRKLMIKRLDSNHTLFYCGDGTVEEESSEVIRHFETVCKLLGSELNYRVHSYTAETTLEEREQLRVRLDSGNLQGLVAIRCLDEGVDIPSIKTAVILASSSNPRQFIQRRGRVLRPYPNKKNAEIFDMIVVPPKESGMDFEIERMLLTNEFKRYLEFADLAENAGAVRGLIADYQQKYGLHTI